MTSTTGSVSPRTQDLRNAGVAILAAAGGAFLVDGAGGFRGQAALFPRLVGLLLLAVAAATGIALLVVVVRRARSAPTPRSPPAVGGSGAWRVGAIELLHVALIVAYVLSLSLLGFRVTTFAYLVLMQQLLGYQRWVRGALMALAFVFLLDWFFFSLLSIREFDAWLTG